MTGETTQEQTPDLDKELAKLAKAQDMEATPRLRIK